MAEHKWEPCTTWRQFYWLWLKVAITHAWSVAEIVGFALVLLVPLVPFLFPKMQESSLAPLAWQIPLGVLAAVGFVRLLCAPYWIYRDRHHSATDRESALLADLSRRNETITALTKPKHTPAEQHDYDKLKKALEMFKETGLIALRHIRGIGTLKFGGMYSPTLPSGLTPDKALWVYHHCATEGLLTCTPNLGRTEETFSVPQKLDKILDEVLFPDENVN